MKIIFSRKGFDSTAGGCPSPIVGGRPVSLPIPASEPAPTTYACRELGETVTALTRGRITGSDCCHDDPLFAKGQCWFGQASAAQGHLANNRVTVGDVFLFFGLFADEASGEPHHRLFGYLRVVAHGVPDAIRADPLWREPPRPHPHFHGRWPASNTLYFGPGRTAASASPRLRLTRPGGPLNRWKVPPWLKACGLSYHGRPERWIGPDELDSVKRGQEFVCDIGERADARDWLAATLAAIEN